ncbi:MAG: hypothetical protein K8U57_38065 [Planctomycetes bacterium]|nr:hypothetical protein [Planctomycetota bacterium]
MNIRFVIKLAFLGFLGFVGLAVVAVRFVAWKDAQQARVEKQAAPQIERVVERKQLTFSDPTTPTVQDAEIFGGVLTRLGDAISRKDVDAVGAAFDGERFTDELDRRGVIDRIPGSRARNREECIQRACPMFGTSLAANESFQWDQVDVRRIRWSSDRTEAIVSAQHRHPLNPETVNKVRWWFVRTPAGWKVYDLEELDLGIRFTELLGLLLTKDVLDQLGTNPKQLQAGALGIREAIAAIVVRKNVDEAERHLDAARRIKLPPILLAIVRLIEARIFIEKLNPEEALKRIDEADQLHPNIPVSGVIRSTTLTLLGRPDEALPLIRKYLDEIGPDADGYLVEGAALEGLRRPEEAAAAYRKSLDQAPDVPEALEALRRVLPEDQKAELGTRLTKAADPVKLYEEVLTLASEANDTHAIEELLRGLRLAAPNDVRGITPNIRRLIEKKKFTDAATEMKHGLSRVKDAEKRQVLNTYLYSMSDADRHLEAYNAIPKDQAVEAFKILASDLEDALFDDWDDKKPDNIAKHLRGLVAAHRKQVPSDVWLGFYDATLLQNAKEYEKAERGFAAAHAEYLKTAKPTGEKDWRVDQFRYRRVECLYSLKQGLKAFAEIGPEQETFQQLAYRYAGDSDASGLENLVAARRKRSPDELQLLYWSAKSHELRNELGLAADEYLEFVRKTNDEVPNYHMAATQCVRNYLRVEQLRDARAAVMEFGPDVIHDSLRAAVLLAEGQSAEVEAMLAGFAERPNGAGHFYYDEDFARLMARPENAMLRKKYPDSRTTNRIRSKD